MPLPVTATLCPVCAKPSQLEAKPFCCERCRQIDLGRWFAASYAVPAVELDDVEAEALDAAAHSDSESD